MAAWEAALKKPFDPWVENHDSQTILRSKTLDALLTATEVRDRAAALIGRINGAMALSCHAGSLRFAGGVTQFMSDGKRHRTIFTEMFDELDVIDTIAAVSVIGPDGKPVPPAPAQESDVQAWVSLADTDDLLDDALVYFGTATEWFDIYKTLETLILRFGGQGKKAEEAFLSLGWALKPRIKLLKQTANWVRHAKRKYRRPSKPMELSEARQLIDQLLRRALLEAARKP